MTLLVAGPLLLAILATIVVGFVVLLRTPVGRWTLGSLVLTVSLVLVIGVFGVVSPSVDQVARNEQHLLATPQPRFESEAIPVETNNPTDQALPNEPSASAANSDNNQSPSVGFSERVHDPKMQRMVAGRIGGQPDWLRLGTYLNSNPGRGQLTSERFATTEEARAQLFARLLPQLERELTLREPRVENWKPTLAQIEQAGIIEREAIATHQLSVGEFTEPVQEVTWAYNFSNDAAMQRLQRDWQRSVTTDRIPMVAAVLIGMALLFAIASGVLYRSGQGTESASLRQSTHA